MEKVLKLPRFTVDMQAVSTILQRFESRLGFLGRRRELRYDATGNAQVFENTAAGQYLGSASLRNVSASGVCIAMEQRLSPGSRVHLAGPGLGINAIVRHTAAGSSGYVIGLEVTSRGAIAETDLAGLPATW